MTSVDSKVLYDSLQGLKLNMYEPFRRSSLRKHYTEVDEETLPRSNRPALTSIIIPDEHFAFSYLAAARSPLSPHSLPSKSAFAITAAATEQATLSQAKVLCSDKFPVIKELFISPHPDDICYSCFSTVEQGKEDVKQVGTDLEGERVIVTVFSKSRCANGELGDQLKRNVEDISRVRKTEDEQFAAMVGCKLHSLGQPDSSARDEFSRWTHLADQTVEEQQRVVKLHSHFQATYKAIAPILRWAVQCKAAIYMPLGVGCHVDHLLTRVAVTCIFDDIKAEKKIEKLPIQLTYYEDLPYAFYVTEQSIQDLAKEILPKDAKSSLISVDQECWEKKQKAVQTYATQMKPTIIPALNERAQTLASLENVPSSSLKERIWTV
jgi:LmbE family N-acetylglucosaminyl deacetylase